MIFYVIFGDFVGWDWGTPAILQQKHPWKNWIKIWDWHTPPPPSVGTKTQIFPKIQFEGSPKGGGYGYWLSTGEVSCHNIVITGCVTQLV